MNPDSNYPTVSVIIPVFNDQSGLEATVDSLARQTYPKEAIEIVIVDNGSREKITLGSFHSVPTKTVVCEKPGSYAARNLGVRMSNGKVLAFIDADCIAEADWLSAGVAAVVERNGPVGGEIRLFSNSTKPNAIEQYQLATGFYQQRNIEKQRFSATANLFVQRHIFETIGAFDDNLFSGGDRDWGWRAYASGHPVTYAPQAIVNHPCRRTLKSAIHQARRVAGGRLSISARHAFLIQNDLLRPHHNLVDALKLLLRETESGDARYRVLLVGGLLWFVRHIETLRLKLGGTPLR